MSTHIASGVLAEDDEEVVDVVKLKHANERNYRIKWANIPFILYAHVTCFYAVYLMVTSARIYTGIFGKCLYLCSITY